MCNLKIRKNRCYYFLVCVTNSYWLKSKGFGPVFRDNICLASARTGFDLEILYIYDKKIVPSRWVRK